ncbi:MAG: transporter substrate-binding domain-containing protein [Pseudomonadota bacterium]
MLTFKIKSIRWVIMKHVMVSAFLLSALVTVSIHAATKPSTLVVGTTGDYPPLTRYHPDTRTFSGSAIQLIEAFAKATHRRIKFVRTTWVDLSNDLQQGKFQMAVGGISSSPERAKLFLMSDPVLRFGKVALVRCGDEGKYNTLKKIDCYPTRVVENLGGTNAQFAHDHIKNAVLIIVPKNALTFDYLIHNKADVMFTDSTEAIYRQQQHDGLCAVNPAKPYTNETKVFLFRKNEQALRQQFNAWLKTQHK